MQNERLTAEALAVRQDSVPTEVYSKLSEAELAVFQLAGRGHTTRRIAEVRHVSWKTVEHQIRAIYEKTGVTCRDELIDLFWSLRSPSKPE